MAEIRTTLYSSELQKLIFPDNSFYKKSIGETGVADKTEQVEKPVQTKISKAKEGKPSSLPLSWNVNGQHEKVQYDIDLLCSPAYRLAVRIACQLQQASNQAGTTGCGDQHESRRLYDGTLVSQIGSEHSENDRKRTSVKRDGVHFAKKGPDERGPSEGS